MHSRNSGFLSSIGNTFEASVLVDIGTVLTLALNLYVLTMQFDFGQSITTLTSDPVVIAAQASAVMLIIYVAEAFADKARGHR